MTQNAPFQNIQKTVIPIKVGLPNGMHLQADKICTLPINTLPPEAKEANVVQGLDKTLISIGKLYDAGYEAIFIKYEVGIYKNKIKLLQGTQNQQNGLWEVPLVREQCNMTCMSNNSRAMVRFLYAALGSPSISIITRAIHNGYLKSWPSLTIINITKHIQYNDAIMKGHMDRVQKNVRSTKKDLGEDNIEQEIKTHWAFATVELIEKIYNSVKALDMCSFYTIMILTLF